MTALTPEQERRLNEAHAIHHKGQTCVEHYEPDPVCVAIATALAAEFERGVAKGKNSIEPWQEAACENGHHDHAECSETCSCWGAGKSRIEQAEERAEQAEAKGREAAATVCDTARKEVRASQFVHDDAYNQGVWDCAKKIRALSAAPGEGER